MRIIFSISILFFAVVLLMGCPLRPAPEQIQIADYGAKPANVEQLVGSLLKETLKDPGSMKNLRVDMPQEGWISIDRGMDVLYGYWATYSFQAEDNIGGRAGRKSGCAFILNNKIVYDYVDDRCEEHVRLKKDSFQPPRRDADKTKYLGLTVSADTASGLVIGRVQPESPADRAGLRRGDIIIEINRREVRTVEEFERMLSDKQQDKFIFFILRFGERYYVAVKNI